MAYDQFCEYETPGSKRMNFPQATHRVIWQFLS